MKYKDFTHVIITDEKGVPMVWSQDQLTYCSDEYWQDDANPVKAYTKKRANELIRKTIGNRVGWKMNPGSYKMMPIKI